MRLVERELPPDRILGIDIENAPRWGFTDSYVHDQLTAVSWRVVDDTLEPYDPLYMTFDTDLQIPVEIGALEGVTTVMVDWRRPDDVVAVLLAPLWEEWEKATHLLGHNFKHDAAHLQGTRAELLLSRLEKKPVIDTWSAIPAGGFRDLDSLAYRFGLGVKPHLSKQAWSDWHQRGTEKARRLVAYRNAIDVVITERLYRKERELGWLQ